MSFKSGRLGSSWRKNPSKKSMFRLRSCASSMMSVSYARSKGSLWVSASKIPSVISLMLALGVRRSLKRTL